MASTYLIDSPHIMEILCYSVTVPQVTKVPLWNSLPGPAEETGAGAGSGHQEHLGGCSLLIQVFPPL